MVAKSQWTDVDDLIAKVQQVGKRLIEARPSEIVIGNVVCQVLRLIRDEAAEDREEAPSGSASEVQASAPATPKLGGPDSVSTGTPGRRPAPLVPELSRSASLFDMLLAGSHGRPAAKLSGTSTPRSSGPAAIESLRSEIIGGIEEIRDGMRDFDSQIAAVADTLIQSGDSAMVYQPNATVEKFLLRAARERRFRVFNWNTDGSADEAAQRFHKKMVSSGVQTVNLRGTAVMAYMPAVNKVIINARGVMSDGSVVTDAGAMLMARAAKKMGKSVLVLAGISKLSPHSAFDLDDMTEWASPAAFVSFSDAMLVKDISTRSKRIETVPAELIDVYVTNL